MVEKKIGERKLSHKEDDVREVIALTNEEKEMKPQGAEIIGQSHADE